MDQGIDYLRIAQLVVSCLVFFSVAIGYLAWKSKQNLDRRNSALGYSLTKNKQYFEARNSISGRFKKHLLERRHLTEEEVKALKENNDPVLGEIRFVLSHWEVMSISIFDKIIDEKTCFEMVGSTLVDTIDLLEAFVADARSSHLNRRRYDYLMILHSDWKRRLVELESNGGTVSRYKQYIDLGRDRAMFERKLTQDLEEGFPIDLHRRPASVRMFLRLLHPRS